MCSTSVAQLSVAETGVHTNIAFHAVTMLWEVEYERHVELIVTQTNDMILRLEQSKYFAGLCVWRFLAPCFCAPRES